MSTDADREIERLQQSEVLAHLVDAQVQRAVRRGFAIGAVRWSVAAALYWWFWSVEWVRWTLLVSIPAALFFTVSMWRIRQLSRDEARSIARRNDRLLERM